MITYRKSAMPIKEVKRILLEHYGSESYISEMSDSEIRSRVNTILIQKKYQEIIDSMRK